MSKSIEQLSFIVSAISICFLLIITSINFYLKIRRKFPANVNCWFCNTNTKVPYTDFNSWRCPSCEQYNGFTEGGDYNCDIPAQRSFKLNQGKWFCTSSNTNSTCNGKFMTPMNGLCEPCNRNQELKVQQLASFEPENEAYFDEEVEEFRYKLEQAYRLCPRCERCLKRTLNRVKNNILGSKLHEIGAKGLRALDLQLNNSKTRKNVLRKRHLIVNLCAVSLIVIAMLHLFQTSQTIDINKTKLDAVFSSTIVAPLLVVISYISAMKILIVRIFEKVMTLPYVTVAVTTAKIFISYIYLSLGGSISSFADSKALNEFIEMTAIPKELNIESAEGKALITNTAGCLLSIFVIFMTGLRSPSVLSLVLWSLDMAMPSLWHNKLNSAEALIFDIIKLCIVCTSFAASIWNFKTIPTNVYETKTNSSFHRILTESQSDVSDESDVESDLNISLRSNASYTSLRSRHSFRSNRSTLDIPPRLQPSFSSSAKMVSRPTSAFSTCTQKNNSYSALNKSFNPHSSPNLMPENSLWESQAFDAMSAKRTINPYESMTRVCSSPLSNSFSNAKELDYGARCSSRNSINDIPDDFESGITRLSISGVSDSNFRHRFPMKRSMEPDSISLSGHRKPHLLFPSRLSSNNDFPRLVAAHKASWVAGGFWNNSSPQKRQQPLQTMHMTKPADVYPIMSRTSSQSSGFESMKNGNDEEIEADYNSTISDPRFRPESHSFSNGTPFFETAKRPHIQNALSNHMKLAEMGRTQNHIVYCPTVGYTRTHSLLGTLSNQSNAFDAKSTSKYSQMNSTVNLSGSLNHIDKNFPPFPKGSLLKIPEVDSNIGSQAMNGLDFSKTTLTTQS